MTTTEVRISRPAVDVPARWERLAAAAAATWATAYGLLALGWSFGLPRLPVRPGE